jgi:hypothetical protein
VSTPRPTHVNTPLASLPTLVRDFIEDRYLAGTANAEAQYQNAAGDEDTLTGALGALIATSQPVSFRFGLIEIVVQISYRKLRGRGKDAPEKRFGADGIFQLQVTWPGRSTFQKGLPFQSKKNWKGRNSELTRQAKDMLNTVGGGIVIDYTPNGYKACEIAHVIETHGNRRAVDRAGHLEPLGQLLAHRFLDCQVGIQGLYYDDQNEKFLQPLADREIDVFDTRVSVGEPHGVEPEESRR